MKKCIFLLVVLAFTGLATAQNYNRDNGNNPYPEVKNVDENGCADTREVVRAISNHLGDLEQNYLVKLNNTDSAQAGNIIRRIRKLLNLLPANGSVVLYQVQHPDTEVTQDKPDQPQEKPTRLYSNRDRDKPRNRPMRTEDFERLKQSLNKQSSSSARLQVLQVAVGDNYFKVDQLLELLDMFSFSDSKIQCVEMVYPKITDRENSHSIISAFNYDSDRQDVQNIIDREDK